jgi:hypothetical protein
MGKPRIPLITENHIQNIHMKNTLTLLTTALLSTGFASAATIVQTKTFSFVPSDTAVLTFNEYNPLLYPGETLTGVSVEISYTKTGGSLDVDNDSLTGGTISLTHSVLGSLDIGSYDFSKVGGGSVATSGTPLKAINTVSGITVGATTGDRTDQFNVTNAADYYHYAPADATKTVSGNLSNISQFQGASTYDWTFGADQTSNVAGLSGVNYALVNSSVNGHVTVTYTTVPEPSTNLLGLIPVSLFVLRRRR